MIAFLNGLFVPEADATVSIFDRSFLYGDGLFETILVRHGKPFRWRAHWDRLERGARFLRIRLPFGGDELAWAVSELAQRNGITNAVVRLTLSRGVGPRGYSAKGADRPLLALTVHAAPSIDAQHPTRWQLITSSVRLSADDPLAQFKTANKLHHVLARMEAEERGADEAMLLNGAGEVAEASGSNLFWLENQTAWTTPLDSGALPGVTRGVVLEICGALGIQTSEQHCGRARLEKAEGVFLTLSSWGIVEAISLDGKPLRQSAITERLHAAYQELANR